MQVITRKIGKHVLRELEVADDVRLAVAYFSPDRQLLSMMQKVASLKLVISEEFTVNDPRQLEALPRAKIRSVPPEHGDGKLHAKVMIVQRKDGSTWVLIGSANMTSAGMFTNREVCVAFDTCHNGDEGAVSETREWFDDIFASAREPDLAQATKMFSCRRRYRLDKKPKMPLEENRNFWALKTTSGKDKKEHWPEFLSSDSLLIGWESLKADPSAMSSSQLDEKLKSAFPDYTEIAVKKAASTIRKFIGLKAGDIVVICKGYVKKQGKPVHIYGLARVLGPFKDDPTVDRTWRFKQDAAIQVLNVALPKDVVAEALGKDSMRETIHELDQASFDRLAEELRRAGIQVEV